MQKINFTLIINIVIAAIIVAALGWFIVGLNTRANEGSAAFNYIQASLNAQQKAVPAATPPGK